MRVSLTVGQGEISQLCDDLPFIGKSRRTKLGGEGLKHHWNARDQALKQGQEQCNVQGNRKKKTQRKWDISECKIMQIE